MGFDPFSSNMTYRDRQEIHPEPRLFFWIFLEVSESFGHETLKMPFFFEAGSSRRCLLSLLVRWVALDSATLEAELMYGEVWKGDQLYGCMASNPQKLG